MTNWGIEPQNFYSISGVSPFVGPGGTCPTTISYLVTPLNIAPDEAGTHDPEIMEDSVKNPSAE